MIFAGLTVLQNCKIKYLGGYFHNFIFIIVI